jgi:hypothetical protein
MSLLRIIAGYQRDDYREEVPQLLYVGYDADEARRVSDNAGPEFLRIELIESRRGQRLRKNPSPVVSSPALASPASPPEPSKFESMTVAELQEMCDELGVDYTGFRLKAEYIAALELDEALSELTIAELRAKAIAAGINTAGFTRKRDYLDALELLDRSAAAETPAPAEPGGTAGAESAMADDGGPQLGEAAPAESDPPKRRAR